MSELTIAAFTAEIRDPSSRYRIRQYIEPLDKLGIIIDDYYSIIGKYPPVEKHKRLAWLFSTLVERFKQIQAYKQKKYDCVILQREMISTLYTFERLIKHPYIFDVDDAVHLGKRSGNINSIAKNANSIICGNEYLANYYGTYHKSVYIVPTPIDTEKYIPLNNKHKKNREKITIGWIGTSGNFKFLYLIEKALKQIIDYHKETTLLIISNERPAFKEIKEFQYIKWCAETENSDIQKMDIGLMPLDNSEWSKGKCSFKMLQYMSCGIPVVVSPVGMNLDVLKKGEIGFGPIDYYTDWIDSLRILINDRSFREARGLEGRKVIEDFYSLDKNAKKLHEIILNISDNQTK